MTPFSLLAALAVKAPEPFQATDPLRNPFWPVDYDYAESELEPITTVPVVDVKAMTVEEDPGTGASAAAAAKLAKSSMATSARNWSDATKALKFSGKTIVVDKKAGISRTAFIINGNTYGTGDLISVNHNGRRYTWRILQRTDMETLKLEQVRVVDLPTDDADKTQGEKK